MFFCLFQSLCLSFVICNFIIFIWNSASFQKSHFFLAIGPIRAPVCDSPDKPHIITPWLPFFGLITSCGIFVAGLQQIPDASQNYMLLHFAPGSDLCPHSCHRNTCQAIGNLVFLRKKCIFRWNLCSIIRKLFMLIGRLCIDTENVFVYWKIIFCEHETIRQ